VLVINMARDKRRREDMKRQLDSQKVDYEFFTGVDGKMIPQEDFEQISDKEELEAKENRPISELKGMVGCTYSHYLIYNKMVDENLEKVCVLEDDVILSSDFAKYLDFLQNEIQHNEIVSLHTLLFGPIEFSNENRKFKECEILTPTPAKIRGAQGYVITKYCAEQLMKEMMPIKEFPDCFIQYHLFCPDVQIRVLYPFILRHMWIESVRDDKMSGIKAELFNHFQKYRIFPFWNIIRSRRRKFNDRFISSFMNSPYKNKMYHSSLKKVSIFDSI